MTKTELARLALLQLGVISSGETPTDADSADMIATYDRYYAELVERRLASWSAATIPDRIAEHVARIVGNRMRSQFFGERRLAAEVMADEKLAERPLLEQLREPKTEARTKADYF
jgi:hypothetical protein